MDRDPGASDPKTFVSPYPKATTAEEYVYIKSIRDDFKVMISKVSSSLTKNDIDRLCYLCTVSPPTDQETESRSLKLLVLLEKQGRYSHTDIKPLEDLLKNVDRCDLVSELIEPYKSKLNSPDYATTSQPCGTPNQLSRPTTQSLPSQPKLIPRDPSPKHEYSKPIEESMSSKDVPSQGNQPVDDKVSTSGRNELVLSKSTHSMDSLHVMKNLTSQDHTSAVNSVSSEPHKSPFDGNQETEMPADHTVTRVGFPLQSSTLLLTNVSSAASLSQSSLAITAPLSTEGTLATASQTVRKELYKLETIDTESNDLTDSQQKSPTSTSDSDDTIIVSSSSSSTNKTTTPTPSSDSSTPLSTSGTLNGASALSSPAAVQENSSNDQAHVEILKCSSRSFHINRKKMGKIVLNHDRNSSFKHKFIFHTDKKQCSSCDIKLEVCPCGLGEDGEGDDRYASCKVIITTNNQEHMLLFSNCKMKLIIQVSLMDRSGSSHIINEVSGVVTLERDQKRFEVIISKLLSHNQIIHEENKFFEFHPQAELSCEELKLSDYKTTVDPDFDGWQILSLR